MPARDPGKPAGYYCDGTRHAKDCPDKTTCNGCAPPCSARAGAGTNHVGVGRCSRHLGSTRNHVRAAEVVLARQAVASLGLRTIPTMGPEEAILDELHRAINNVEFLEALVRELPIHPEDDEYHPPEGDGDGYWTRGATGIYGRSYHVSGAPTGEAKPHVLVVMLNEERDRLTRVSLAAVKANVSKRVMELHTGTARKLAGCLSSFARLNGIDTSDPQVIAWGLQAMREAGGGSVGDEALQIAAGE